jgi:hypothetical protein
MERWRSMKLDSEDQRQTILNCIQNAVVSGSVGELMPLMTKLAELTNAVQSAAIESEKQAPEAEAIDA